VRQRPVGGGKGGKGTGERRGRDDYDDYDDPPRGRRGHGPPTRGGEVGVAGRGVG